MGLFDSVWVECPHCGARVDLQSKAAEAPYMDDYTTSNAPLNILHDVMNHPEHCRSCDGWLVLVDPRAPLAQPERPPTVVRKIKPPKNPKCHPQGYKWWPDHEPFGQDNLD